MWIDSEKKKKEEKSEEAKEEMVQAVWVVIDIRKIITKTGKQMMFLKCEWYDYDFEVVIFPKDVDKFKDKLEVDKIVIVNWNLWINFEFWRKSIQARDIKIATISMIREQAKDLWLFNNIKRFTNKSLNKLEDLNKLEEIEKNKEEYDNKCIIIKEDFDKKLEEKIENNRAENPEQIMEDKYVIKIPNNAIKQDLLDLKEFMQTQETWFIKVFINLKWQDIDTKISLGDLNWLTEWVNK